MTARGAYRHCEVAALTVGASEVVLERNENGAVSLNVYGRGTGDLTGFGPFGSESWESDPRLGIEFAQAIVAALDDRPRFVLAYNARGTRGVLDRQTNLFAPGGYRVDECNADPARFEDYMVSPFDGVDPLALAALPEDEDRPEPGPEPEPSEPAYTLREIEEAIELVGGVEPYEHLDRLETALTALRTLKGARS